MSFFGFHVLDAKACSGEVSESGSEDEEDYTQEEKQFGGCFGGPQGSMLSSPDSFAEPSVCAAPTMSVPMKRSGPYQARSDDQVDLNIAEFFRMHPQAYAKNSSLTRVRPGVYLLHGRMIEIDMQNVLAGYGGLPVPTLMVKDGPLRQQFGHYIENKEDDSAQYSGSVFQTRNAIDKIPQTCRMTFHDTGSDYSRKEAMMVAKEQAIVREKAATLLKDGQAVGTSDLKSKYARSITMKLGRNRGFEDAASFAATNPSTSMYSSLGDYFSGSPQMQSHLIRS